MYLKNKTVVTGFLHLDGLELHTSPLPTVATNCTHGNVRLAGGLELTEGRVEVCVQGKWTGVCDSYWNYQDAFVVCRQLGYPATGSYLRLIVLCSSMPPELCR